MFRAKSKMTCLCSASISSGGDTGAANLLLKEQRQWEKLITLSQQAGFKSTALPVSCSAPLLKKSVERALEVYQSAHPNDATPAWAPRFIAACEAQKEAFHEPPACDSGVYPNGRLFSHSFYPSSDADKKMTFALVVANNTGMWTKRGVFGRLNELSPTFRANYEQAKRKRSLHLGSAHLFLLPPPSSPAVPAATTAATQPQASMRVDGVIIVVAQHGGSKTHNSGGELKRARLVQAGRRVSTLLNGLRGTLGLTHVYLQTLDLSYIGAQASQQLDRRIRKKAFGSDYVAIIQK